MESVELEELASGRVWTESVDTVVFTGDWIPDHELVRRGGVEMDPGTWGPASDAVGRTSIDNLYTAGNLMHPVESADVAAFFGPRSRLAFEEFDPSRSAHFERVEDLVKWLEPQLRQGDTLLVKGSRGMKLERVVDALSKVTP